MSEVVSATDNGAEVQAQGESQAVDPVNAFEALLDKHIPTPEQAEDAPEEPSEPEEVVEDASEEEPEKLFTVKIDGKEVQVTESELLSGYQRAQSANQRFEQAAQERKAAQSEYQKVAQERTQAINSLHIAQQVIQSQMQEQPNWAELIQQDPVEYLQKRHEFEQKQAQLQQLQAQQWQLQQIQAQENEAAQKQFLSQQYQMLQEMLPDWKDQGKAQTEKATLKEFLGKQGYTKEEIDGIVDARNVVLARKAMLYDQMMAKAQETAKKVQQLPKVQRPGVQKTTDGRTRDMQALRKTGSTEAAASIFEKLL